MSGGTAVGGAGGSSGSVSGAGGSAPDNPPPPLTGTSVTATISATRGAIMGKLTAGAAGFSFEKSHLSDAFFTATHAPLIAMLKLLGPGVVRIGADDVNNAVWMPNATFVKPGTTSPNVGTAEVDALADFLTAAGWKAIYAVNMRGSSTPQTAVTELDYVVPKLGSNLVAVEIGNELNLYPISNAQSVWHSFAQAIRAKFPSTKIAGPGDFEDINYATNFIKGEASLIDIVTQGFDAGIRYDDVLAEDMVVVPILPDMRFVVVASPEYLAGRTLPQQPQDLLQHECLNYRSAASGALPRWDFEKDGKHTRIAVKGRLATNDSDLLLRAALDGFGFAYLSHAPIAEHVDRGALVSVLEDWVPTSTLYLYYFERNNTPKKLRAFIDFLKAQPETN